MSAAGGGPRKLNLTVYQDFHVKILLEKCYIPPFQRLEDEEHVCKLQNAFLRYYLAHSELTVVGIISLSCKEDLSERYTILDGQHRTNALKRLARLLPEVLEKTVRVDLYTVQDEKEELEIYHLINSSKKVELYNGDVGPYVIPRVQKYFRERFPKHIKTTANPQKININLDHLAKRIEGHSVLTQMDVTPENVEEFIGLIQELNEFYSQKTDKELKDFGHKEGLIKEARESGFYLGLYRKYEWLDRLIEFRAGKGFTDQAHSVSEVAVKNLRKKIPAALRKRVWAKYYERLSGDCRCCGREIQFDDFDCGHILSVKDGGKNTLENLDPVCRPCNLDMASMNMERYKRLFVT